MFLKPSYKLSWSVWKVNLVASTPNWESMLAQGPGREPNALVQNQTGKNFLCRPHKITKSWHQLMKRCGKPMDGASRQAATQLSRPGGPRAIAIQKTHSCVPSLVCAWLHTVCLWQLLTQAIQGPASD